MERFLAVMLGAGLGGLARYGLALAYTARYGGRYPVATFVANVTGCFLIGLIMTRLDQLSDAHPLWRLFLIVGFLGGYTTFSSFSYESFQMLNDDSKALGLLYMLASVMCCYIAVWAGIALARR